MGLGDDLKIGGPLYEHVIGTVASNIPAKAQKFMDVIASDGMMVAASDIPPEWAPQKDPKVDIRELEREIRYLFVEICIMRVLYYLDCEIIPLTPKLVPISRCARQDSASTDVHPAGTSALRAGLSHRPPAPKFPKSGFPATIHGQVRMAEYLQSVLAPLKGKKLPLRKFAYCLATSCTSNPLTLPTVAEVSFRLVFQT